MIPEVPLTSDPEVDIHILSNLEPDVLESLCFLNSYVHGICQDDMFWQLLVENKYPRFTYGKEENETWQQFAKILPKLFDRDGSLNIESIVKYGRLAFLEKASLSRLEWFWLIHFGASVASKYGHLNILKWLVQRKIRLPPSILREAVKNGYFDILDWLFGYRIFPGEREANLAAANGRTEVLDWMIQRGFVFPIYAGLIEAVRNGHVNMLDWAKINGYYLPTTSDVIIAAENARLSVLRWLRQHYPQLFDTGTIGRLLLFGHFEILRWLVQEGLLTITPEGGIEVETNPNKLYPSGINGVGNSSQRTATLSLPTS